MGDNYPNLMQVLDFKNKKIQVLRSQYEASIVSFDDILETPLNEDILNIRHQLIQYVQLDHIEDKINIIITFFVTHKSIGNNMNLMYLIFTKSLNYILLYENTEDLKKHFISYCNFLFEFISKEKFSGKKIDRQHFYNFVKILSFDMQSLLVKAYSQKESS